MHKSFRKQWEILILRTRAAKNKRPPSDRRENRSVVSVRLFSIIRKRIVPVCFELRRFRSDILDRPVLFLQPAHVATLPCPFLAVLRCVSRVETRPVSFPNGNIPFDESPIDLFRRVFRIPWEIMIAAGTTGMSN